MVGSPREVRLIFRANTPSRLALEMFFRNRFAAACLAIVLLYVSLAFASWSGFLNFDYTNAKGPSLQAPNMTFWFGTDILGRDVFAKVLHGAQIAFSVGLIASCIAIPIGFILGALAGYFRGWVDDVVVWLYSTMSSIPGILLLMAMSFVLGRGLISMYVAVGLTSWVDICRVIRAEVLKQKEKDYVLAARSLGASHTRIIFVHVLPNVMHLLLIDFSLRFIYAIKSEAILSYLGLGVQGEPSWGIMIADAKGELINGVWWQLAAATGAMFFLVLSLNIVGDALRDVLDPRTKS